MLSRNLKRQIDQATKDDIIKPREGVNMIDEYTKILDSHTYLEKSSNCNSNRPLTPRWVGFELLA